METRCERRGQCEVGIITHDGHVFAAFGEALAIAEHWSEIDAEDEADPWHGEPIEPDDGDYPDW